MSKLLIVSLLTLSLLFATGLTTLNAADSDTDEDGNMLKATSPDISTTIAPNFEDSPSVSISDE